ncbi:nucleotidyltransferase family protein [Nitrospinaceae bacterium]|nr:nucleotidyltransferase family protein [Nitrospinaceae bacterium]
MKNWEKTFVDPSTSIKDAIRILESSGMQISLVVDHKKCLLGAITDGDIRRAILKGISLERPVEEAMNKKPTVASPEDDRNYVLTIMKSQLIHHVPIVNKEGVVVGLETVDQLYFGGMEDNWIVLMAGGLGTRLLPLTKDCPKPMIKVGNKPLLELTIQRCIKAGFRKFFISVNYKAEMIKSYFKDGSKWGIEIQYIHEEEKMGTAGSIGLLPQRPDKAFLVMNCDLVTNVNLVNMFQFHQKNKAKGTMGVCEYMIEVPYGVVEIQEHKISSINEKPTQRFLINGGIYVLEPETLELFNENIFLDMPELFNKMIAKNWHTSVFPIREYWIDVGQISDLEKANYDFNS